MPWFIGAVFIERIVNLNSCSESTSVAGDQQGNSNDTCNAAPECRGAGLPPCGRGKDPRVQGLVIGGYKKSTLFMVPLSSPERAASTKRRSSHPRSYPLCPGTSGKARYGRGNARIWIFQAIRHLPVAIGIYRAVSCRCDRAALRTGPKIVSKR
jgi:hypothetical protein